MILSPVPLTMLFACESTHAGVLNKIAFIKIISGRKLNTETGSATTGCTCVRIFKSESPVI